MSVPKLILDSVSPVCRAVLLFVAANKIPHEVIAISLKDHENASHEQLAAVNPNKLVPAMIDGDFSMFESTAILRYLATKYDVPKHWYPSDTDLQARAKVDEALAWYPGNLRCRLFYLACVLPRKTGQPRNESIVKAATETMKKSLNVVETYFLHNRKFIAGDEISIADILFMCEVTQYWLCQVNLCKGRPNMTRWLEECQRVLAPHFEELHKKVYSVRDSKTYSLGIDL